MEDTRVIKYLTIRWNTKEIEFERLTLDNKWKTVSQETILEMLRVGYNIEVKRYE